jgi:benzoyl-CoA reductase/2-hydroxyglutaryl-CoA dehydratase subunit BcrC/BadD/HgdB
METTMAETPQAADTDADRRKIKSVRKMKEIMTNYYIEAKGAAESGKKVAWITSGGPVEPLIAMDVIPVYPENHGAMVGASKMGADLCETAEEFGYPRELCSYARSDIACSATGGGPIGGLPEPDFLVCCNNICGTVMKWYEVASRHYGVPLFILDTPFTHREFSAAAQRYVLAQIYEYVSFLETQCGKKMDYDRMEEVGRLSVEGTRLWQEVLDAGAHKPAPFTAFDAFFHMALIVTLRGTQITVDYYRQLRDEMHERIEQGIAMVPNEKYRLLWDNLPIWYRTRWLSEKFASHGACLVGDTYTSAWSAMAPHMRAESFLESMSWAYTQVYINVSVDIMFESLRGLITKYDVDGLVMHSNRSCKPYSLGQYELQKMVLRELDLPTLILEADMVDERSFSESQIETRIDAFMETLKS